MAEGELPTSQSQTRLMNAPPVVSTEAVSLVSTTTSPATAHSHSHALWRRLLPHFRHSAGSLVFSSGWARWPPPPLPAYNVCTEQLEPVAHSTVQYSTVCTARTSPSLSLIAWAACCLLEETPVKTRGRGGKGREMGGGGHAKKPGECD